MISRNLSKIFIISLILIIVSTAWGIGNSTNDIQNKNAINNSQTNDGETVGKSGEPKPHPFEQISSGEFSLVCELSGSCPRWDHASTPTIFTLTLSASQSVSREIGFDNSACTID